MNKDDKTLYIIAIIYYYDMFVDYYVRNKNYIEKWRFSVWFISMYSFFPFTYSPFLFFFSSNIFDVFVLFLLKM